MFGWLNRKLKRNENSKNDKEEFSIKKLDHLNTKTIEFHKKGQYQEAAVLGVLYNRKTGKVFGKDHPDYADSLTGLYHIIKSLGYDKALIFYEEKKNHDARVYGKDHPDYATSLNTLAILYESGGKYDEALPLCREAVQIRSRVLGKDHPDYATSLNNLANLYNNLGRYDKVLPLYQEALKIRARVLGEDHPDYATSLNNLANLYNNLGRYDKALPLYQEALKIRARVLGKDHHDSIGSLSNLANLYKSMGRYDEALPLYQEALEISARLKDHPDYATSLNTLAILYESMGRYDEALPLCREAVQIRSRVLGEDHPDYATSLNNLAILYNNLGRNSESLSIYQEALKIIGRFLGKDHPDYATILNNLANLYNNLGRYDEALSLYQEALKIIGRFLGKDHPDYATILNNLAILYESMGSCLEAYHLMMDVFFIDLKLSSKVFSISNEKQRSDFLKTINFSLDRFLSLVSGPLKENIETQRFAAEVVLNWKGMELETSKAEKEVFLVVEHPEYAEQFQELQLLKDQYVRLILAGPRDNQSTQEYQRLLKELNPKIDNLESELAMALPEMNLKKRLENVNNNVIANNIPIGAVLVDFIRFDYFEEGRYIQSRYLAFVFRSGDLDNISMVDLGDADVIEQEIQVLRQETTGEDIRGVDEDKISSRSSNISNNLESLLLKPILDVLGDDCDALLVSPDGDLSILPFEIIPYKDGYLMDRYEINYLGTGRDLLRLNQESGKCSSPMVMVDPDFNYSKEYAAAESGSGSRSYLSRDFNRDEMVFTSLPGTKLEGENISKILYSTDPKVLMGYKAVETRLKTLKSPWILHLATHGFFLPDQKPEATNSDGSKGGLRFTGPGMENPLIRSGLAFAGANTHPDHLPEDAEDGIFTAEEASGLNLLNTELVVLSACETGLGEIKRGEGVFGLRRSFVLAGARTLVMSLWKVNDLATCILMERFYQNIIEKNMGRNQGLKEAKQYLRDITIGKLKKDWLTDEKIENGPEQLQKLLKNLAKGSDEIQPFKHPRYWGAFICQGDPKPLQKKTRSLMIH